MTYKHYVKTRKPLALWMLDDTSPLQEHTGSGYAAAYTAGSQTTSPPVVSGAEFSSIFSNANTGRFQSPVFQSGLEGQMFALEAWIYPGGGVAGQQKILSNVNAYDGLTLNGNVVSFGIDYANAPDAVCSYDLRSPRAAHVVGVYTLDRIYLYVNGQIVAEQELTDAQKVDAFTTTDQYLYSGTTVGGVGQVFLANAVAVYSEFSTNTFELNFDAGRRVRPQTEIVNNYGGKYYDLVAGNGSTYFDQAWETDEEFLGGFLENVNVADGLVRPVFLDDVSQAGTWTVGLPLDVQGITNIYAVYAEWSGTGITVQSSVNGGTSWSTITSGRTIQAITNNYAVSGKDLMIRVVFAGGIANDPAQLDYLRLTGFKDNLVSTQDSRMVTVGYPAVPRNNYEPIEYREENGVILNGGTLVFNPDTSTERENIQTLEAWVKPTTSQISFHFTGTRYQNGALNGNNMPLGRWTLIHIVGNTVDNLDYISIGGTGVVGQVNLYPRALSLAEITRIYRAYRGLPQEVINDSGSIAISEPSDSIKLYSHSWSIEGA